jgi:hypothetical protein
MKTISFLVGVAVLISCAGILRAEDTVIVHEWGTFTCLQDENGEAIGGINVDDEPVPNFVYNAYPIRRVTGGPYSGSFGLPPYMTRSKGWQPADSDVTMRLETPVLYIYPPKGATPESVPPLSVHVDFHQGLLSQYFPYAETKGFPEAFPYKQRVCIEDCTTGLTWKNLRLVSTAKPIETNDRVWTTPREVSAPVLDVDAQIYNGGGGFNTERQAEHFLFYRGLGHLDSPLAIGPATGTASKGLGAYSLAPHYPATFESRGWLTEIRADGSCALIELPSIRIPEKAALILKGGDFKPQDFAAGNLAKLKASMQSALVKEGLYPDEASAMLRTWELSYFKSPGLRFFYIVPRAWVDKVLPLAISGTPVQITRVMVGRIELISDEQRQTLARLGAGPCPDLQAIKEEANNALQAPTVSKAERELYYNGTKPLSDLGVTIPPWVQAYLSLGRFRDALIVHEEEQHPTPALAQFIKDNQLAPREN